MGRFSGLAEAMSVVADKLKADREEQQAMGHKQNLLGYEGLIKGHITPTQETEGSFNVPGVGRVKNKPDITEQINKIKLERESPLGYQDDLNSAISAINSGKNAEAVFQRIGAKYPYKSAELKRVLLPNQKEDIADIIRAARGE